MFISMEKLISSERPEIASTLPQVKLCHHIVLALNLKKPRKFCVFNIFTISESQRRINADYFRRGLGGGGRAGPGAFHRML